jgi:hypothetical protein
MSSWLPFLITGIATVLASWFAARLGMAAARAKAEIDRELGSGELALRIASDLRSEQESDHRMIRDLRNAWREHVRWDRQVLTELRRLDPDGASKVPSPPTLEFDGSY